LEGPLSIFNTFSYYCREKKTKQTMLNLSVILEDSAKRYPTKPAFTFMDTVLSYAQINGAANMVANGLVAKGIKVGDKVALSCPNLPFFPIIYFGIIKAGAVVVPLSVLLKKDEIEYHLRDSEAKAYCCFTGVPDLQVSLPWTRANTFL
jgi:long-chain acyl-CoA synthetase